MKLGRFNCLVLKVLIVVNKRTKRVASVNKSSLGVERKLGVRVQNKSGVRIIVRLVIMRMDSIIP